ncbi:hypothetical protein LMG9964_02208 [Paraburkholderia phenoliruptrix]|uniref:Uncharacterized protein n=1 Tax=Paraburkholderia phenoliruptrix TaxID=252970 RepID=A0A6J5K4C6_9BURK|nr:hypothetical protein LMG9964_02208 [Paraburkholderia phenoliruptrix]
MHSPSTSEIARCDAHTSELETDSTKSGRAHSQEAGKIRTSVDIRPHLLAPPHNNDERPSQWSMYYARASVGHVIDLSKQDTNHSYDLRSGLSRLRSHLRIRMRSNRPICIYRSFLTRALPHQCLRHRPSAPYRSSPDTAFRNVEPLRRTNTPCYAAYRRQVRWIRRIFSRSSPVTGQSVAKTALKRVIAFIPAQE